MFILKGVQIKILSLCYEYPPIGGGGAKVVDGLTQELVRQGEEVDLVTMGFGNLPPFEEKNGLNIYRVKCLRFKPEICSPFEMLTYLFSALPLILKLCRKNNYDLNHTHFIYPDGILAFLVKRLTGLPYIITAHGSDVPGYNPDRFKILHRILTPLWRIITAGASRIIIPSKNLGVLIRKACPEIDMFEIPNGINLNKFSPYKIREDKILLVSRMFERKGVQYFIRALSGLDHNYTVNIVGEGPYLDELKKLSGTCETKLNFTGFLDNNSDELRELYETSRIFVYPSGSENFPVALLEAMIAGLAIITTNDTGCAEVVGDDAILVNSGNPFAIRDALLKLMDNRDLCKKLGRSARTRAQKYFGWEIVAGKHIKLYSKISGKLRQAEPTEAVSI